MKIINVEHEDGVPWFERQPPFWLHRCRPATSAATDVGLIRRCACGATRYGGYWFDKNQTRRNAWAARWRKVTGR